MTDWPIPRRSYVMRRVEVYVQRLVIGRIEACYVPCDEAS